MHLTLLMMTAESMLSKRSVLRFTLALFFLIKLFSFHIYCIPHFWCILGQQSRSRSCVNGVVGQQGCDDIVGSTDTRRCAENPCAFWTQWSESDCSTTCGPGELVRHNK